VAGNAITHGIFAKAHVLPGVERAEDWEVHRAGMLASLEPADYLEIVLAERAADLSWKLQRFRRYETALLRFNQPECQQEVTRRLEGRAKHEGLVGYSSIASIEEDLELAQLQQASLEQLAQANTMLSNDVVQSWLGTLIEDEGLDRDRIPELVWKLRCTSDDHIPAAAVLQAAKVLAQVVGKPLPAMLGKARKAGKAREATLRKLKTWVHTEQQLLEPLQLLPRPDELPHLMRYEAHLSRLLFQTIREIEARQARRRGESTPLVRVDINSAPADGEAASLTREAADAAVTVAPRP